MTSQRHRRLDAVVARLQLAHGTRAIRRAGPDEKTPPLARIATSFAELDAALDGGLPQGRITEISGPATSGKLTIAAKAIATAHRLDADVLAAWIDPSHSLDPDYMHRCGVDLNRLLVVHPVDLGDVFSIVLHLVESNTLALLVVDSLAPTPEGLAPTPEGLAPTPEGLAPVEADVTRFQRAYNVHPTETALAGQTAAFARLSAVLLGTATALVFLLADRPELQNSSHALASAAGTASAAGAASAAGTASAASVRITLRRERWITRDDGDVRGYVGQAEITKNRFGNTGVRATVRITFNGTVRGDGL